MSYRAGTMKPIPFGTACLEELHWPFPLISRLKLFLLEEGCAKRKLWVSHSFMLSSATVLANRT